MAWTTPDDVRAQVQRLWERGRLLAARVTGEALFPFTVHLARPRPRELAERFAEARAWIRVLEAGSKAAAGAGYDVVYTEIKHRQLGANRVPQSVVVPSPEDALALLGKQRQAETFDRLVAATRAARAELLPWVARHPLELLDHAEVWERLVAVVSWFRAHPRPGIYARQIDVEGVHTKLIEGHRRLLAELLDQVLPAEAVDREAAGVAAFERRYGLLGKPSLVRLRMLDERLNLHGLDDVTAPVVQLARFALPARNVFVTENEINGLVFPRVEHSIVIFGLGYWVEALGQLPWLADKAVFYWGDLDTHGFAILDGLRAVLPQARSFLMDRETLLAHRRLWVAEPDPHDKPLSRLTATENSLFEDLRHDRLGKRVRLEQERIGFGHLTRALAVLSLDGPDQPM